MKNGLNYAMAPRRLPYEGIICNVDCLVQNNVRKEDLEAIRQDISQY